MPTRRVGVAGRAAVLAFEAGEEVVAGIAAAARELGLGHAVVHLHGSLAAGRMVLGRRKYSRATDDPDRVSFQEPYEVVGTGSVGEGRGDEPAVLLHCSVAREREVFVGRLVEAAAGERLTATLIEVVVEAADG